MWVDFGSSHQVDGETEVCGMPPAMTEALSASPRSYKSSREEEEEEAQREFMGGPTHDILELGCCTSIASF